MDIERRIDGYCDTQKRDYSIILACIDNGSGSYLKGTVDCEYVKNGGSCNDCSIRESHPNEFK